MNIKLIYRILSYILLIVAAFIGIGVLAGFFIALANPALLLNIFIAAAVVMYSISSFLFLINGIDGKKQLKTGMKDFIRVNGFVALFFCIMNLFQSITVIMNPAVLNEAVTQRNDFKSAESYHVVSAVLFYSVVCAYSNQFPFAEAICASFWAKS